MVDIHWFLMVLRSLTKLKEISEMGFKSSPSAPTEGFTKSGTAFNPFN